MFRTFSLKQIWITLVLFAVITPVTIVMIWYGQQLYLIQLNSALTFENQKNNELRKQVELEVKRLQTLLENKTDPFSILLDKKESKNSLKDINSLLKIIVKREHAIREIIILSKQSKVVAAVEPGIAITGDKLLSSKELDTVASHWGLDNKIEYPETVIPLLGRMYIGSPKKHEDFMGFSIAIPIGDPVKAILVARIDINRLWEVRDYKYNVNREITHNYILDRRGSLITEIAGSDNVLGKLMTSFGIARAALINKKWSADSSYIGVMNELVYGTFTTIPTLNWSLVSEVSASKITGPIWSSIIKIVLITLFGLILFIWLVLYLANRTIKPIQQTCDAINHVANGDYQHLLGTFGIIELDQMGVDFNNMVEARVKIETLLQEREQNLYESRKRYRSLFEKSGDASMIFEDGCFSDCNQASLDMFGYSTKSELCNLKPSDISPKSQSNGQNSEELSALMLKEVLKKGSHRFEFEHMRCNGEIFPVEILLTTIMFEGEILVHAVLHDITFRKQQAEFFQRTQKMEALGKLTGGIAHDYNNMLGVVLGYAEILKDNLIEQPELLSYVDNIQHAGERGAKLTSKLLSFSRTSRADIHLININNILRDAENMLEKTLTARIKLELKLENHLWPVTLDENEFEDALLNLSINAMYAIDKSGRIIIATENKKINEIDAEILNIKPGDYVMLTITDSGSGMSEATKENIFDPFYTTKGDKGTGLGLSQVYGFIKSSEGAIKVESEQGVGTIFKLYFPCSKNDIENDIQKVESNPVSDLRGTETILVVDDELALLTMCAEILIGQGYNVITASSAKSGLDILESKSVDIIVSDVIMPEMNGYEFADIVQNKYPNIKIQMVSGFTGEHHLKANDKTLHEDLLYKPYGSQSLLTKIRELLLRSY